MNNFVGLLQEKCQKNQKNLPTYLDIETDEPLSVKKCVCKLYNWTTEGSGNSKKNARQNAAQLMLTTLESNGGFVTKESKKDTPSISLASKIHLYADKNKKSKPLYSEKESDNGLFVVEYKFDGYTAEGKGSSKKIAKERALDDIATRFKIHDFYDNYSRKKERIAQVKNSIQKLLELCQRRKLPIPSFQDKTVKSDLQGKTCNYVVSCLVNDLMTQSAPSFSKRNAKEQAASLMIDKLNKTTHFDTPPPGQSPVQLQEDRNDPKKYSSKKPDVESSSETDQPYDEDHSDWDDYRSDDDNDNSDENDDFDCDEEQDDTDEEDKEHCYLIPPEANLSDDDAPLAKRMR